MKTKENGVNHNTRSICIMAMLIAIAVVLSVFSVRIGSGIKISFKFLPVVVCSIIFGPFRGGICGGLSDFLAYLLNPAGGAYLFPISIVEFLYGVSYGLFLYRIKEFNKKVLFKLVICVLLNTTILSMGAMAYILKELMNMTFIGTVIYRLPSTILNMIVHTAGMIVILKYIPRMKKIIKLY